MTFCEVKSNEDGMPVCKPKRSQNMQEKRAPESGKPHKLLNGSLRVKKKKKPGLWTYKTFAKSVQEEFTVTIIVMFSHPRHRR